MNWNLHQEFSSLILKNLFFDKTSSNVTLVAENNQSIDVHRFVLTYASSFFRDVFVNNPEKHLTLHLQGLKYETLENLVKYIYIGEVLVRKESWKDFMTNAKKWNLVKLIETQNSIKGEERDITEPETNIEQESGGEDLLCEPEPMDNILADVKQEDPIDYIEEVSIQEEDVKPELPVDVVSSVKDTTPKKEESINAKKRKIRFECDLCEKDFAAITDLMKHKRNHSTNANVIKEENHQETTKASDTSRFSSSSQKAYNHHPCDMCHYSCSRPIRLRQHKKRMHGVSD